MFTEGSLEQLRSLGFQVLYFPYMTLVAAFAEGGLDIAFDEKTPDTDFQTCVRRIEAASRSRKQQIERHLIEANLSEIDRFMHALDRRLKRLVERIVIIPLYGRVNEFVAMEDAIRFLDEHRVYEGTAG